jgi:hypothetical protein
MTRAELIAELESERARLNAVLAGVQPDQVGLPEVSGTWSVKDMAAHLAVWTARLITVLFHAERGGEPPEINRMLDDWDALNDEDYQAHKDRPYDRVMSDFHASHRQLIKRLSAWREDDLLDAGRFPWLRGRSMGEFVRQEAAEHDADHRAQIEAWLNADV